jgi:UDP-2-acetamido-3-amino-2,3-dideoxy-glucuronate N-acetyltransferase
MQEQSFFCHPTAEIERDAWVGNETQIWRHAHVRSQATIGEQCIIGKGVFIDRHVRIGERVKIQNNASLFAGVTLEDGVFVGPHVCFTNDMYPRAITPAGALKNAADWVITPTLVRSGASIGAGAVIVCGVVIGSFALVGAGAVVTKDVAAHSLVIGNPARFQSYVCCCAHPLTQTAEQDGILRGWCAHCGIWCLL